WTVDAGGHLTQVSSGQTHHSLITLSCLLIRALHQYKQRLTLEKVLGNFLTPCPPFHLRYPDLSALRRKRRCPRVFKPSGSGWPSRPLGAAAMVETKSTRAPGAKAPRIPKDPQRSTGPGPGELPPLILPASDALPRKRPLLILVRPATACGTQLVVFDAPPD